MMIELTIAMSVIAVSLLMLHGTLIAGHSLSRHSRDRGQALSDIKALMEQIEAMPITTVTSTFTHDAIIPPFNDLHLRNQRVRVRYANAAPDARPLQYDVVCTYESVSGRPATVMLRGVRNR